MPIPLPWGRKRWRGRQGLRRTGRLETAAGGRWQEGSGGSAAGEAVTPDSVAMLHSQTANRKPCHASYPSAAAARSSQPQPQSSSTAPCAWRTHLRCALQHAGAIHQAGCAGVVELPTKVAPNLNIVPRKLGHREEERRPCSGRRVRGGSNAAGQRGSGSGRGQPSRPPCMAKSSDSASPAVAHSSKPPARHCHTQHPASRGGGRT